MNEQQATGALGAACAAIMLLFVLVSVVAGLVTIIGGWKTFSKAGRPGWAIIVPFYNVIVMLDIAGKPWWWLFLLMIPFVNIYFGVVATHYFSLAYGRGVGTTLGLIFLGPIFWLILGFGSAQYQGAPE